MAAAVLAFPVNAPRRPKSDPPRRERHRPDQSQKRYEQEKKKRDKRLARRLAENDHSAKCLAIFRDEKAKAQQRRMRRAAVPDAMAEARERLARDDWKGLPPIRVGRDADAE